MLLKLQADAGGELSVRIEGQISMDTTRYDVVIVGGGAAGLSAATTLGRALRSVLVIDSGTPRNAPAAGVHGYLSRDGMAPGELLSVGRSEVLSYGHGY